MAGATKTTIRRCKGVALGVSWCGADGRRYWLPAEAGQTGACYSPAIQCMLRNDDITLHIWHPMRKLALACIAMHMAEQRLAGGTAGAHTAHQLALQVALRNACPMQRNQETH